MPYTPPSLASSGITWAQLQSLGFHGTLGQVSLANGLSQAVASRLKSADTVGLTIHAYSALVDRFLSGDPIDITDILNRLTDLARVFRSLAQAADDVNTLISANAGTVHDVFTRPVGNGITIAGQYVRLRRTWP